MVECAQWLAVGAAFLSIVMNLADKKVVHIIRAKSATSLQTALDGAALNPFYRRRLKRLQAYGIIQDNESKKWYLNEEVYLATRKRRLKRLVLTLLLLTVFAWVVIINNL